MPINPVSGKIEAQKINDNLSYLESEKRNKSDEIKMTELSQEVRLGMTGGAVPVVGPNVVDTINLKNKATTPEKTDFLEIGKNLFNKNSVISNSFLQSNGNMVASDSYDTSRLIAVQTGEYNLKYVRFWRLINFEGQLINYANTGSNNGVHVIQVPSNSYLQVSISKIYIDLAQIERGNQATDQESFHYKMPLLKINQSQIEMDKSDKESIEVEKNGDYIILKSNFVDDKDIQITTQPYGSNNSSLRLISTSIDGTIIHTTSDDVTPIRTSISTLGANHGYTNIVEIIMANHGKTNADLGSTWTDGVTEYVLLLVNGNILTLGCPFTVDSEGITQSPRISPVSTLTHVVGATNTTSITISSISNNAQLYPSVKDVEVKFSIDGREITENGTYYGSELKISEKYTILDYKSLIEFAKNNIGISFKNGQVDGLVQVANDFVFSDKLNCTTYHSLLFFKKATLGRSGFLQSAPLEKINDFSRKRFLPNTKVKNGFDFSEGVDLDSYASDNLYYNTDNLVDGIPPNHYVDWLIDFEGNKKYGFAMGYIVDKTNSRNEERLENTSVLWDMRGTKKVYPIAIEGTHDAYAYFTFAGFRNYLSGLETKEATAITEVKDKNDVYVYADVNLNSKVVSKELKELGKSIDIVQDNNLILLNKTVDGNGIVLLSQTEVSTGIYKLS